MQPQHSSGVAPISLKFDPKLRLASEIDELVNAATPILSLPRAHIQDHQCCFFASPPSPLPPTHTTHIPLQ